MAKNNLINRLDPSIIRKPILKFSNIFPIIDGVENLNYQKVKYLFLQDIINKAIYFASPSPCSQKKCSALSQSTAPT